MVEIKDGELSTSARKLTKGELEFKQKAESVGCTYHVITSIDEALEMINHYKQLI